MEKDAKVTRETDHEGPPYVDVRTDGFALPGEIFKVELDAIKRRKGEPSTDDKPEPRVDRGLTGLALSGGGIRSAAFALGAMQRLAKEGLFNKFDYLSTVSGGGYIGSSISWLLSPHARDQAGVELNAGWMDFPYGTDDPAARPDPQNLSATQKMLRYLRQHGNYLTPGGGITLTSLIAVVLRAILLNLMVWLPIGVAIMWMLMAFPTLLPDRGQAWGGTVLLFHLALALAGTVFLIVLVAFVYYSFQTGKARGLSTSRRYDKRRSFEEWIRRPIWWILLFAVVGSLPIINGLLKDNIAEAGGIGSFLVGAVSGVWTYFKTQDKDGDGVPLRIVAPVASVLVIYGMALMCYQTALWLWEAGDHVVPVSWNGMHVRIWHAFAVILLIAVVTGWHVNLNYISVHRYYRDRLMEAFMPNVKDALENRTGPSRGADPARLHDLWGSNTPPGPYHIVNTNVVLVDSKDRTRFIRGGDSFILSPLYCGSHATGWRRTEEFMGGEMTLATAMAISGAAAHPNTGVGGVGLTRSPLVSLLMALLNLRLGYWAANPDGSKEKKRRPNHFDSAKYELGFGNVGYREDLPFIQLSDGGHFENLGVYELIRRKLRLVVVCDGGADPDFTFSDLQTAVRRCGADFRTSIEFDGESNQPQVLIPKEDAGYPGGAKQARQGHIVGTIIYGDECAPNAAATGTLIFLKTTMIADMRLELKGYKGANRDFPDQSTADQFFDEEQFEAYRELGYRITEKMVADLRKNSAYDDKPGLREFIPKEL